ncbi:MAG: T9SS type A sorting domain-containing protein [Bacteroidota bacterium]|nr:T9SS type A sorting domain-containing protein [Bacteroidota bacterium]
MRNFLLFLLVLALGYSSASAQYVTIPDPNLMEALLEHGVDTNGDLFISFEEAEAVDSLTLLNGISDMTGIEAFINLVYLDLFEDGLGWKPNTIEYLDVSANTSLEYLDCSYNQLDTLIIGNNDKLLELNCFANTLLSHLDFSGCPNLRALICGGNPLEELDISNSTQLEVIYLDEIFDPFIIYVWMLPFPPEGLSIYGLEAEVQYVDIVAPSVMLMSDHVHQPRLMEFRSSEDGIAYLVNSDTLDNMDEIRSECIDSLEVTAGVPQSFDLSGTDLTTLWIQAADKSLNISEAGGFTLSGVGIQNDPDLSVEIYPNPATELITVSRAMAGYHTVEIADINGRIIFSTKATDSSLSIDLREFSLGLYFLRISDGQTLLTRKFIKQ